MGYTEKAPAYSNLSKRYDLCLTEKFSYMIISADKLNKRSEIILKCRHQNKFYLSNFVGGVTEYQQTYVWHPRMRLISVGGLPSNAKIASNINVYVYFIIRAKAHDCNLDGLKREYF